MKTIFLVADEEYLYIEMPDVLRAFGGDIINIYDDSETATRAEITAYNITLTVYFNSGRVSFSLLPMIREAFFSSLYMSVSGSMLTQNILLSVNIYDDLGNTINTVNQVTAPAIYGAAPLGEVYGGQRFITYNPNFPNGQYFTFLAMNTNQIYFNSTALPTIQKIISGNNGITRAELSQFFQGAPVNAVISTDAADTLINEDLNTGQPLTINVEIDNRAENVVFVRWLDNTAMQHYRAFTFGTRTRTATTDEKFTPARIVNNASYTALYTAPFATKKTSETITFGDDAINEKYLPEIESLCDAPKVEIYNPGAGVWERVVLSDTAVSERRAQHVFNFNAVVTRTLNENISW